MNSQSTRTLVMGEDGVVRSVNTFSLEDVSQLLRGGADILDTNAPRVNNIATQATLMG